MLTAGELRQIRAIAQFRPDTAKDHINALLAHIDELVALLRRARQELVPPYHYRQGKIADYERLTEEIDAALALHDAAQGQPTDEAPAQWMDDTLPDPSPGDLPPGRRRVYEAIARLEAELGHAPSIREIAHAAGLASTSTVHLHLTHLLEAGLIRRATNKQGYVIARDSRRVS